MKYKTPTPTRTLTRARLDAAVYDLYLRFYDKKTTTTGLVKLIKAKGIGAELLDDLRSVGCVESQGYGRGQKHSWTGAPPTEKLIDQIEKCREHRASIKAKTMQESMERKRRLLEIKQAAELAVKIPLVVEEDKQLGKDELLDLRLQAQKEAEAAREKMQAIDAKLRKLTQPRLF